MGSPAWIWEGVRNDAHGPRPLQSTVAWHCQELGRLVAQAGTLDWEKLDAAYGGMLMEGLGVLGCERGDRG